MYPRSEPWYSWAALTVWALLAFSAAAAAASFIASRWLTPPAAAAGAAAAALVAGVSSWIAVWAEDQRNAPYQLTPLYGPGLTFSGDLLRAIFSSDYRRKLFGLFKVGDHCGAVIRTVVVASVLAVAGLAGASAGLWSSRPGLADAVLPVAQAQLTQWQAPGYDPSDPQALTDPRARLVDCADPTNPLLVWLADPTMVDRLRSSRAEVDRVSLSGSGHHLVATVSLVDADGAPLPDELTFARVQGTWEPCR